jgi:Di-haem cytochrome c peroxidase
MLRLYHVVLLRNFKFLLDKSALYAMLRDMLSHPNSRRCLMKLTAILSFFLLVALLEVSMVYAVQGVSIDLGKKLFSDPKLGTAGKSCNTCHTDGKGLSKAGANDELPAIVNACITQNLKGRALDVNSVEMKSLILYIRSLGQK